MSAYELEREVNIARNRARLVELGLETVVPPKVAPTPRSPKAAKAKAEPTRASKRVRREVAPEPLPLPDDDDDDDSSPEPTNVPPAPKRRATTRPTPAAAESVMIGNVRRFIEEYLPEDHTFEERTMFGMCMWLVRGHMFLGVGVTSDTLLVRVGEPAVERLLASHPVGVRRCASEKPGATSVFPGTLLVEPAQYRGDVQLRKWFEHACAYNSTMQAKEPSAKPRKNNMGATAAVQRSTSARPAVESVGTPVVPAAALPETAPPAAPRPRPASTSGGAFARCVLHVVQAIPRGRVASYGQVAALAGAPRNARQVGHLLKEGLCAGGLPWWRVIGASGKSSLPVSAGGDTQRTRLEGEGVVFRASGAVDPEMWWARAEPFYA
jgi:methylated-DNA-protein-cysteine methyltransferase-like protein